MSVKNKTVNAYSKDDISCDISDDGYKITEMFQPLKSKETIKVEGSADEIVDELVEILKNKLKVV